MAKNVDPTKYEAPEKTSLPRSTYINRKVCFDDSIHERKAGLETTEADLKACEDSKTNDFHPRRTKSPHNDLKIEDLYRIGVRLGYELAQAESKCLLYIDDIEQYRTISKHDNRLGDPGSVDRMEIIALEANRHIHILDSMCKSLNIPPMDTHQSVDADHPSEPPVHRNSSPDSWLVALMAFSNVICLIVCAICLVICAICLAYQPASE
ncbi:MAG: hypothetical protein MMC23_000455 [Stictis urceolatum]|nr:hypothetical protein [Stictis urceolata]